MTSDANLTELLEASVPQELAFPLEEYEERLRKVRKLMDVQGLDALLVHSVVDICYLTGYQTLWSDEYVCLIGPAQGMPILQVADFEVSCAVLHGPLRHFETLRWKDLQSDLSAVAVQLAGIVRAYGLDGRRIGIQKGRIEI